MECAKSRIGKFLRSYDACQTGVNPRRIHECLPASQRTWFSKQVDRYSDFRPFFRHKKNPTASLSAGCVSRPIFRPKHTRICLVVCHALPGRIHHFRRIQAVNLERYIAAQDIKKVHGTHVPRYENGVFQQISRSQISQVRSQSDVGLSRESEPQKFSGRRIRAEDPRNDFLLLLPPVQKSRG